MLGAGDEDVLAATAAGMRGDEDGDHAADMFAMFFDLHPDDEIGPAVEKTGPIRRFRRKQRCAWITARLARPFLALAAWRRRASGWSLATAGFCLIVLCGVLALALTTGSKEPTRSGPGTSRTTTTGFYIGVHGHGHPK